MGRPAVQLGTRLGRYEILTPLGKGGMGEVYLARDTSVGRDVAVKVLPADFVADPRRLGRIRREARLLASLNHPNIATLYSFEEPEGDPPFLVLELIEGETLTARLGRGSLPMRGALNVAVQIADALQAAHECGVIHRDLKPSNVMLTMHGTAKLLDFGVARQDSGADASLDTVSHDFATTRGQVVGTPAYMSPEQARGSPADQQSDIWAFGCVLYEMTTGRHPFAAASHGERLTAIQEKEPKWEALEGCPDKLRAVMKRCLAKDPRERLHHIADARIEIQEVLEDLASGASVVPSHSRRLLWPLVAATAAASVVLGALGITALIRGRESAALAPEPVRRFAMDIGGKLAFGIDYPASIAISPKGDLVAYVADVDGVRRIHVRSMDEIQARPLEETTGAQQPFFSPDGRWLGFFAGGKLKKISVRGGAPVALAPAPNGMGGAWSREGWIVFAPSDLSGLQRVSDSGGETRAFSVVMPSAGEQAHWKPTVLPDGRTVLFTVYTGGRNTESGLGLQGPAEPGHRVMLEGGSHGRFLRPRWLVYGRAAELLAVEFDPAKSVVTGTPFRVLEGVQDTPSVGAPLFAISDPGTLVYAPAVTGGYRGRIVWLDRTGRVSEEIDRDHAYARPRLSPDGTRVAFHFADPDYDVWVKDLARGTRWKLTKEPGWDGFGVWSPDGRQIAFSSAREGARNLFVQSADGSGAAERLLPTGNPRWPTSWSPNGQWLAYQEEDPRSGLDIWLLDMRTRRPSPFLQTSAREWWARFSRSGDWLAYQSNDSGSSEVYVSPLQEPGRRLQVSIGGGGVPIWSSGDAVYYSHGSQFEAASVRLVATPVAEKPRVLFGIEGLEINDVDVQGNRFLAVDVPMSVSISRLHVVLGWPQALARMAEGR